MKRSPLHLDTSPFFAEVRDISLKGLGVLNHPDGTVCFAAGCFPKDAGYFVIERRQKNYGLARLLSLTQLSPYRKKEVECLYAQQERTNRCGGCLWIPLKYDAQLAFKQHIIEHNIKRAGLDTQVHPIKPSTKVFHYRNRVQVKTNGEKFGFFSFNSHNLIDIEQCLVLNEPLQENWSHLRRQLPCTSWIPQGEHDWVFLDFDDQTPVDHITPNKRGAFRQANDSQNEYMRAWVQQILEKYGPFKHAIELFCGSGNFTEILAHVPISEIFAYECSQECIKQLTDKQLPSVKAFSKDLFRKSTLNKLIHDAQSSDLLVLDPPRRGFQDLGYLVQKLKNLTTCLYISCDLASFLRDTRPLRKMSWVIEQIQPVDQFPHTPHIEILALLRKKNELKGP